MTWRDEFGAEDLIRQAYPDLNDPNDVDDGGSLALQIMAYSAQQKDEHSRQLEQLADQRSQIEAAAELVGAARRELEEARASIRRDQYVNGSAAAGLLMWTSYCLDWSGVPHPATGFLMLVGAWALFYHYRGRRWLQGDL